MSTDSAFTILRAAAALKNNKPHQPAIPPSKRSQEIFRRVVINCERQSDVAKQLDITPSRVCQIVRRVREWIARGAAASSDLRPPTSDLSHLERRRLDRYLAQARNQTIYEHLMREVARQLEKPQHTTIRTESKPHDSPSPESPAPSPHSPAPSPASEITKLITTVRDQPLNVQLLKAAHRSALELERLAEREPLPEPEPEIPSDESLYAAIFDLLYDMRRRAEQEGRTVKSTNLRQLIGNFLCALLGKDQGAGGGFFDLDDSIRQLVRRFVIKTIEVIPHNPEPEQFVADILSPLPLGEGGERSSPGEGLQFSPSAPLSPLPLGEGGERSSPGEGLESSPSVAIAPHPHPSTPPPLTTPSKTLPPPPASSTPAQTPLPASTSNQPSPPASRPNSPPPPTKKSPTLTPPPHSPRPAIILPLFTPDQIASVCDPWTRDY